jgi:hypothetical protein
MPRTGTPPRTGKRSRAGEGITWEQLPTVAQIPDVEIRREDHGDLAVCMLRLGEGLHTASLFEGLPDDQCQCPHWGYMIRGTIRVHTSDGYKDFEAGEAYYWPPGHNLEAVTDCEYLEITLARDFDALMEHVARTASG